MFYFMFYSELVSAGLSERFSNLQYFSVFHHVLVISPSAYSLILKHFWCKQAQVLQGNASAGSCAKRNLCKVIEKYLENEKTKTLVNVGMVECFSPALSFFPKWHSLSTFLYHVLRIQSSSSTQPILLLPCWHHTPFASPLMSR